MTYKHKKENKDDYRDSNSDICSNYTHKVDTLKDKDNTGKGNKGNKRLDLWV